VIVALWTPYSFPSCAVSIGDGSYFMICVAVLG